MSGAQQIFSGEGRLFLGESEDPSIAADCRVVIESRAEDSYDLYFKIETTQDWLDNLRGMQTVGDFILAAVVDGKVKVLDFYGRVMDEGTVLYPRGGSVSVRSLHIHTTEITERLEDRANDPQEETGEEPVDRDESKVVQVETLPARTAKSEIPKENSKYHFEIVIGGSELILMGIILFLFMATIIFLLGS